MEREWGGGVREKVGEVEREQRRGREWEGGSG
jgi:hypothetical protein